MTEEKQKDAIYRIFVSHYSPEAPLAEVVQTVFEKAYIGIKIEVFTSSRIQRGKNWLAEVKKHLNNADEIITVFTWRSSERPWIGIETGYGIMSGNVVTPLLCRGFKLNDLSDPYRMQQTVNSVNKTEVVGLYEDIYSRIKKKNPFAEKRHSHNKFWEIWSEKIRAAAASIPLIPTRQDPRPVVWLIGSHRHLSDRDHQEKALQVCEVIARVCVENRIQIVMGTSRMLEYLADEYIQYSGDPERLAKARGELWRKTIATQQAQASSAFAYNPVILLGSLRKRGIRETFDDAIGRIPDLAIVIAGRPPEKGGRSIQETDLAAEGKIPVLPISFTGGAAAIVEQTVHPKLREKVQELQLMDNRLDDFKDALLELIETQTALGREETT